MNIIDESREKEDVILESHGLTIFPGENAEALLYHTTLNYLAEKDFVIW